MGRPKKIKTATNTAAVDPMTAAILTGLKPHIDAAVKDKFVAMLVDTLAKIAPERLAKAADQGTATAADQGPSAANPRPESSELGTNKGQNGAKKSPPTTAPGPSE